MERSSIRMGEKIIKTYFTLILIALIGLPVLCFGQKKSKTFDIEINVGYNVVQDFTINYNASVSHWINPNKFAIITGLGISTTYHDLNAPVKINEKTYSIDNNYTFRITGILGMEYLLPIIKKSGLLVNANFLFEPIPIDKASFNVWGSNDKPKYKNKWVFTQFNPGLMLKTGYYFATTVFGSPIRMGVGIGASWQDGLKAYRLAKIDNIRFGSQMSRNKVSYLGFIKVSGYF